GGPDSGPGHLEEEVQGIDLPAGDTRLGGILVGVEEEDRVRGGDRVPGAPRAARHLVEHTERLVEEQDVRPATAEAEVAGGEEDDVAAVPAGRRGPSGP